ncbi:MAG: hypothetical protein IJ576_02685 [Synergistaceae bacterium]|nr:hypothetical protein [Synergistaceae bacterium]
MLRKFFIVLIFLILVINVSCSCAYAADGSIPQVPRAQLDESERYFNRAYMYFMERDYWNALDYLEGALRANTYLVDYYLLKGLTLQRIGDVSGAREALANYLEVRPLDTAAPRFAADLERQERLFRFIMGTRPVNSRWSMRGANFQNEWKTGYTRPFNIRGLGKVNSLNKSYCFADTLGSKIYFITGDKRSFTALNTPEPPACATPMGDGSYYIFCTGGEMYSFHYFNDADNTRTDLMSIAGEMLGANQANIELNLIANLNAVIADAEWLSERVFAVADPVNRSVIFYDYNSNDADNAPEVIAEWTPPEQIWEGAVLTELEFLFEPVALSAYADWLAIADRANGKVYILNSVSRGRNFFSVNIPRVRDVLWSSLGELFALNEQGELYRLSIDFGERTAANANAPSWSGSEFANIWALFKADSDQIYCADIGCSTIHKASMLPPLELAQGFLGIYHPVMAVEPENRESFLIDGTLASPYKNYMHNTSLITQAIWNERTIRSASYWQPEPLFDALLIHNRVAPGQSFPLNLRPAQAEDGSEIRLVLPAFWLLHHNTLTNIIIDASINLNIDDLLSLMTFCMLNGLELDVWARDIPSLALTRASAFTGGHVIYSLHNAPELNAPRSRIQIQMPLPVELSSSGYPGRSMLSVYLDAGQIDTRNWMPLWPDMFGR